MWMNEWMKCKAEKSEWKTLKTNCHSLDIVFVNKLLKLGLVTGYWSLADNRME